VPPRYVLVRLLEDRLRTRNWYSTPISVGIRPWHTINHQYGQRHHFVNQSSTPPRSWQLVSCTVIKCVNIPNSVAMRSVDARNSYHNPDCVFNAHSASIVMTTNCVACNILFSKPALLALIVSCQPSWLVKSIFNARIVVFIDTACAK